MTIIGEPNGKRYYKPPYGIIQLPKVPQRCGVVYDQAGRPVGQTGVMCPGDMSPPVSTTPPATTTPATPGELPGVDGIMDWVKANPMIAAGIAAAAFFMFKGK